MLYRAKQLKSVQIQEYHKPNMQNSLLNSSEHRIQYAYPTKKTTNLAHKTEKSYDQILRKVYKFQLIKAKNNKNTNNPSHNSCKISNFNTP